MRIKGICSFILAILALAPNAASAQSAFTYSKVHFEADAFVDLERVRAEEEDDVFVFFYRKDHPQVAAADSLFFSDERISALLNEQYACYAIDLESVYARELLARLEPGGPIGRPFVMLLNLEDQTDETIWTNWGTHPVDYARREQLDRLYWQLWNFAEHGSTEPPQR